MDGSMLGSPAVFSLFFNYSRPQQLKTRSALVVSPLTWGSPSALCAWWLWVSSCHSAPPRCSLEGNHTQRHMARRKLSWGTSAVVNCSNPVWAPWRPSSSGTGPAGWSAPQCGGPVLSRRRRSSARQDSSWMRGSVDLGKEFPYHYLLLIGGQQRLHPHLQPLVLLVWWGGRRH